MLCKINGEVIEGNVYEIKATLKGLGCVWNSECKRWETSEYTDVQGVLQALEDLNNKQKEKMTEIWREACAINKIKYCAKNDANYDKVRETFRELLQIETRNLKKSVVKLFF